MSVVRQWRLLLTVIASALLMTACQDSVKQTQARPGVPGPAVDGSAGTGAGADPVIVAAGDVSTRTKIGGNRLTSDLVRRINPAAVLTLGDDQYPDGSLADFTSYFEPTWGRFKSKIHPVPGNHEYSADRDARGYFTYFGARASPQDPGCSSNCRGYYSYDVGSWHLIALNSNDECRYLSCSTSSPQISWLRSDLARNRRKCVAAYWHHPRWSSGREHGSDPDMSAFWNTLYAARVDVVLNGHEHNYERFTKQDPGGSADGNGIREFVVGTGGGSLYEFGSPIKNSQVRNSKSRGVLRLSLHAGSYAWSFVPAAGDSFTDSGSDRCH